MPLRQIPVMKMPIAQILLDHTHVHVKMDSVETELLAQVGQILADGGC